VDRRYLLAADVGGTKIDVVLAGVDGRGRAIVAERMYASRDFNGLEPVIADFLSQPAARPYAASISGACLAVAGPVEAQSTRLTNLGWEISAAMLGARFGFRTTELINDFAAAALGISQLAAHESEPLQRGQPLIRGPRVVIGAGTGLGVAILTWDGTRYAAHASEAGHSDFAPCDETQDRLLVHLRHTMGHVSYERIVSGPGLARIFGFLRDAARTAQPPAMEPVNTDADTPDAIAQSALSGRDPVAGRALDLFVNAYGAFAGNLALTVMARGGVYLAGGIAPRIITKLKDGSFVGAFNNKGRFAALLSTVPVYVVMNPRVAVYGALDVADRL
jgi:glucokinase